MKKRTIITTLTAVMTGLSAAALPLAAELPTAIVAEAAGIVTGTTSNGLQYSYISGSNSVTITNYVGSSTSVTIPEKIDNKKVTKIGERAFQKNIGGSQYRGMNITSVTLPSGITEIGPYAFALNPLNSITFPNGLQTIGRYAFSHCEGLQNVTLPASVTSIGSFAFATCTGMTKLQISGPATIDSAAFKDCSALVRVMIHKDCVPKNDNTANVFTNCTSLTMINGSGAWTSVSHGAGNPKEPVLSSNSYARNLIKRFFKKSKNVKFVSTYCKALCDYVVATETSFGKTRIDAATGQTVNDDWMSPAVKARQIHDWIIRHCEYEDFYNDNGQHTDYDSTVNQIDNQYYSSVFLSYALNERGTGVGETVCAGYAKAYTMLLTAAGIESYVVHGTPVGSSYGHAWNIIKINGKYYESDVCAGNENYNVQNPDNPYYTNYEHFLVSKAEMNRLQGNGNVTPAQTIWTDDNGTHEYLNFNATTGTSAINQCNYMFNGTNYGSTFDGLLDNDYNFNGTVTQDDYDYKNAIAPYFNNGFVLNNNSMSVYLTYLVSAKLSPVEVLYRTWNGQHIS